MPFLLDADVHIRFLLAMPQLIVVVYGVGVLIIWRHYIALDNATWYATPSAEGSTLSPAGMQYRCVSVPIFQIHLFRWHFRLFIWTRFLRKVSRIQLSLVAAHPDRFGGADTQSLVDLGGSD